jgi:hypothetical protein
MVVFDDGPADDLKCMFFPHPLDPFPATKVSARAWGKVIHHKDGQIAVDPFSANRGARTDAAKRSRREQVPDLLTAF